jgi:hypothetical protein
MRAVAGESQNAAGNPCMKTVRIVLAIVLLLPPLALLSASLARRHIDFVDNPPPFDDEWSGTPHSAFGFPFLVIRFFERPTPESRLVFVDWCGLVANGVVFMVIGTPAFLFLLTYRRFVRREGHL